MKKRKSKGLAFLVAVAVAFSLLPGVAFAQPVGTAEDLEAALETGGEVTLSASIELAEGTQFDIENAVTLDLNGFSITRAGDQQQQAVQCQKQWFSDAERFQREAERFKAPIPFSCGAILPLL